MTKLVLMLDKLPEDILCEIIRSYDNPEILETLLLTSKRLRNRIYNTKFLWRVYIPKNVPKQRTLSRFSVLGLTECIKLTIHVSRKDLKINSDLLQKSLQYSKDTSIFYLKKGVKFYDHWFLNFNSKLYLSENFHALENCLALSLHLSKEAFHNHIIGNRNLCFTSHRISEYLGSMESTTLHRFFDLYAACTFGCLRAVKLYLEESNEFHVDFYCFDFAMVSGYKHIFQYLLQLISPSRDLFLHLIHTAIKYPVSPSFFEEIFRHVVSHQMLTDDFKQTILQHMITYNQNSLLIDYLKMEYVGNALKKTAVKFAIAQKRSNILFTFVSKWKVTYSDIIIPLNYFEGGPVDPNMLIVLLRLNVTFEDHLYVFEKSLQVDMVFVELLKSPVYDGDFRKWCEINHHNDRCYDIIKKSLVRVM